MSDAMEAVLVERLRGLRNPDGGWGYGPGKASRLEPTCWALLALHQPTPVATGDIATNDHPSRVSSDEAARVLEGWAREGTWLRESAATPPSVAFNGLALLTAVAVASPDAGNASATSLPMTLRDTLVIHGGLTAEPSPVTRQDNSLRGWPWVEGTFSWVEPTSWCLLALKQHRRRMATPSEAQSTKRIAEAERLLTDRVCAGGGWNYGNANVFGADLHAYVPTTAAALLALQDRRDLPAVAQGLAFIRAQGRSEPSVSALALATICARVFGEPAEALDAELRRVVSMGSDITTVAALACACCALAPEGTRAFSL